MRTLFKTLLAFCMLLAFASASPAQTSDGTTPAIETVCDTESGAAYGLCNAFCEAMDCETDDPQASATACGKVKNKYQQITGHEPPCLAQEVCPCIEQLPGFLAAVNGSIVACDEISEGEVDLVVLYPDRPGDSPFAGTSPEGAHLCGLAFPENLIVITAEEAQVCQDFLRAKVAAAGLTCGSGEPEH